MSVEELIIRVFCLIDDELKILLEGHKFRHRGFQPALSDSEVLTMEVVGEFLGHDDDKGLWHYFQSHWRHFFPKIPGRTTFVRHAANLHILKHLLQEKLAQELGGYTDRLHLIDGLPMPVCNIARAFSSQVFKVMATYGYCAAKDTYYYGLHGHVVISSIGVVTSATFTEAVIEYYKSKTRNTPLLSPRLSPHEHTMLERVKDVCDWRSVSNIEQANPLTPEIRSTEEILLCLKRIQKSIKLWTKKGGRRGYINFVAPHVLVAQKNP
jgi:hypothetical protein